MNQERRILMKKSITMFLCVGFLFAVIGVGNASAEAIIKSGDVYLGINTLGDLNTPDTLGVTKNVGYTGLTYAPVGDATSPGCLCEGWGVSGSGFSGYANVSGGTANLTSDSFTTDYVAGVSAGTFATSAVYLTSYPELYVTQAYGASTSASLLKDTVTITNKGAATITDVKYVRVMDWDVPPTEFSEFVTLQGWPATALEETDNNGFWTSDPLVPVASNFGSYGQNNVNFTDVGPNDHGAYFRFKFGDLAVGESITFDIFYGAAENERLAMAALGAVGAEVYSLGQSSLYPELGGAYPNNDGATFIFAFKGVGGTVVPPTGVPEPATMLLFGSALAGLGFLRKRSVK